MTIHKLHSFEELASPQAAAAALRREMVVMPCMTIDENLDDKTVHILRRFTIKWISSPQMLCILTTGELQYLKEAMDMELNYREQEHVA